MCTQTYFTKFKAIFFNYITRDECNMKSLTVKVIRQEWSSAAVEIMLISKTTSHKCLWETDGSVRPGTSI